MCEGPSTISGPIPPDPSLLPEYYKRPASARGRLEGHQKGSLALHLGPLAPDPVLYPDSYSARSPSRRPRVGPNATYILERGQKGVVGDLLRLDGLSITPVPKQKQKVHDFSKDNVRRLREIQRRCKEQEAERIHAGPVPVKALWTSSKYQNVPSRVMAQLEVSIPPVKPQCQTFLKAHSKGGSSAPPRPSPVAFQRPASSSSSKVLDLMVQGHTVDFVKHNARAARKTTLRRSQSLTNLRDKTVPSAVKGQVPQYLEERKKQWQKEEEERKRNAPDPRVPPGHMMLPDGERQETLKSLKDTHGSLVSELLSLPLRSDGLSVRTRRAQLDCKLSEIEEAIKIFSRDRVYVKVDS
ncbi:PREDICTED: enkurin domain-containing protein 1 [Poecilia mexicana]|uniref:Enkurin domain-containing protein n=1 Tax=Poecilia mexicana TaxID=48701 RepID=A0A3B3WIZ1_9TELE|nr:PREDICTED: enkurin domain-containing protein 1 [Poecilia mexicana]XP_014849108.1 PREDICTED: enkurin domain-containing protein 1 [Poecilia mexicana]XP_014849109.1 PREDICTED: enkurin domain-containing protein 1 [Poecilia mexicana]XP_014849110.1 PREDICTED: enkurin domain-containing protein 1 [Poecilia mexicana]XP_014849112.1 PREDICTED: enkurin domain-containing protein 1 [Poecilia mexicana]